MEKGERRWIPCTPKEYFELPAYGSGAVRCFALQGNLEFYKNYILGDVEDRDSDSLRMGRLLHSALENPDGWMDHVDIISDVVPNDPQLLAEINGTLPAGSKAARLRAGEEINTKKTLHRALVKRLEERARDADKEYMSPAECEKVGLQVLAVMDNPACAELLEDKNSLNVEVACVYNHPSGVMLKALVDLLHPEYLVDYKTTRFRTPVQFVRQAKKSGYLYQAAHYCIVTGRERMAFISVTSDPLYESHRFDVPPQRLAEAIDTMELNIGYLSQQLRSGVIEDVDSQGIPINWHTEMWGATLPMDEEMLWLN